MALEVQEIIEYGLHELFRDCDRFYDSFGDFTNPQGDAVSDHIIKALHLSLELQQPHQSFWKTRTLEQDPFHEYVYGLGESMPRHSQPSPGGFEIDHAYFASKRTYGAVDHCIDRCIFHSDDFRDLSKGTADFELLVSCYVRPHIRVESRFGICTPFKPHATIISVQPQQGPPDKLVITELHTLMYWICRYASRGKKFMSFPIRLVSICDTKARLLSANVSRGYLNCLFKVRNPDHLPVFANIEIGRYYEMSEKEDLIRFMKQIVDDPIAPKEYAGR